MRLLRIALLSIALAALLPIAVYAEEVSRMHVTVDVQTDASVSVTETIAYDFGDARRHGIYRTINERYVDVGGNAAQILITDIRVTDESGVPMDFTTKESGGLMRVHVGDADVFVSGPRVYVIRYTAHDVIGFFNDHDEIYWNATGNEWEVPIGAVEVAVSTPEDSTSHACYAGTLGSTSVCDSSDVTRSEANKHVVLFTQHALSPGEGLTVAVGFPKGAVQEPAAASRVWKDFLKYGALGVPMIVLLVLLYLWRKYGRDTRGRGTVIPEYDAPPGISPASAAELVYQRVRPADVSAVIIHLAVLGYLKIIRSETKAFGLFKTVDYTLEKLKEPGSDVVAAERIVLDALFADGTKTVSISDMKTTRPLHKAVKDTNTKVGREMVEGGYYREDPNTIRMKYYIVSGILFAGAVLVAFFDGSLIGAFSLALSSVFTVLFSRIMPAKTLKGALAEEQLLGLKDYLQIAEKNRLDFHHAPEKSPALFEKLLPYAMVLGVSMAWAKEFEGMYTQPPEWYVGGVYPVFSPTVFATEVNAFGAAASAMAAPASGGGGAGGGGSSGGGFGGGGGGSW